MLDLSTRYMLRLRKCCNCCGYAHTQSHLRTHPPRVRDSSRTCVQAPKLQLLGRDLLHTHLLNHRHEAHGVSACLFCWLAQRPKIYCLLQ